MLALHGAARGPAAAIAMMCVVAVGAGGLTRARWAIVPAALGVIALVAAALDSSTIPSAGDDWHVLMFAALLAGAAALAAAGVLLWRSARSTFGTLRALV
jgi:hypothetical protein